MYILSKRLLSTWLVGRKGKSYVKYSNAVFRDEHLVVEEGRFDDDVSTARRTRDALGGGGTWWSREDGRKGGK